ncbi:MAG TPA: hypothetical protein VJN18_06290 [Polyangiaceae bacterium]|nr:hypothetical protein [Polyangiaceae bacterium]
MLDERRQISVGGRDHARIDALGLDAADAPHLAFLEDPQQLGLQLETELADFVEEQRAAVGGRE